MRGGILRPKPSMPPRKVKRSGRGDAVGELRAKRRAHDRPTPQPPYNCISHLANSEPEPRAEFGDEVLSEIVLALGPNGLPLILEPLPETVQVADGCRTSLATLPDCSWLVCQVCHPFQGISPHVVPGPMPGMC